MFNFVRPVLPLFSSALVLPLHAGELRVDINRDTNNTTAVTENGYTRWSPDNTNGAASGTTPVSRSFTTATGENVTVTFAQTAASAAAGGTGLLSNWYKAGAEGSAKLVSDGLTVAPANFAGGGQLRMTITGLSAGTHTLLTYHNAWDGLATGTVGPIDISVNGTQVIDNLQPTIRAASTTVAAMAYVEFSVAGPSTVTEVHFAAETNTAAGVTIRNAMINGFEIDTPNSQKIAHTPSPAHADEHVDADSGSISLSWQPALAGGIASHDVYFGTSEAAVKSATRTAPEFLGNQPGTSRSVALPNKLATCYWRVDEIDALGNVAEGVVWHFRPRLLAFPGAEGHGRFARGGRGGKVVHVTSLADYESNVTPVPGTFRYAIEEETGPRVIVFDTSGLITMTRRLTLSSPYVTIAGQTAPGKGICLRQWPLGMSGANDGVVRFIRNRPGNISGQTIDGGGLAGCNHSIMDHCSISWSIDEGFSSRGAKNITLQKTLISEALAIAGHSNYPAGTDHGYAATVGGDIASLHHNLLAHCSGRNWSLGGGVDALGFFSGRLDIRNNVVYNWKSRTTDGGAMEVNFVNNYYKPGAATTLVPYALTMNHENDFGGSQRCYFTGNIMQGHFNESNQTIGRRSLVSNGAPTPTYETFVSTPFFEHHVTTQSATGAYKRVLSDVGANRPLDDHDVRVIQETLSGTYTYTGTGPYGGAPGLPNTQDDVGGWENYPEETRSAGFDSDGDGLPNWWEILHGTNPSSSTGDFSDANADPENDGYTRLCDYLAWMALPRLEVAPGASVTLDLSSLTKGYTASPIHSVQLSPASAGAGTVQLLADGKTVRFTAAAGFSGIARFTHTVTDSAGDTMSGEVGVRVTTDAPPPVTEPVPPIFVNLSTAQVASGAIPTNAATVTINAPGSGWSHSAAAPIAGTVWNNILRPNPPIGSNSTSATGQYVCNSANDIALVSSTGNATGAHLTVTLDIQDLDSNTTRTEPNATTGGTTALGPGGLMGQSWRIYRGGNGSIHRLTGLPPGSHCHVYFYGSTTTTGQGTKFILNAANVPGGNGTETRFIDIRGGNSGNVFELNGGVYSPTTAAPADTVSTAADSHTWGRLPAVVDATGTLTFRSEKNSANGQYLCGYQIVPNPLPVVTRQPPSQLIAPHGSNVTLTAGAVGDGTLTYQWRKDGQPVTGNASALTDQLALADVQADDAGVYDLVVTNANGSVTTNSSTVVYEPGLNAYEDFCNSYGLDPQTTGVPDIDHDDDGLANAIEFLLGGDPTGADLQGISPSASLDAGGTLVFSYRRKLAASGLFSDSVETSAGLESWSQALHGVAGVTIQTIVLDPETELVTVRIPSDPDRRFARLKVSQAG